MLGCPLAQTSEQKCIPPTLIDRDPSTLRLQSEQSHKSKASVMTPLSETTQSVYHLQSIISLVVNRTLNIIPLKLTLKSIFAATECDSQKHILIP